MGRMALTLSISPHGRLIPHQSSQDPSEERPATGPWEGRTASAFDESETAGLLHLATTELQTALPPSFAFARELSRTYLTRLCHTPGLEGSQLPPPIVPPSEAERATMLLRAPPMTGLEYLTTDLLATWWTDLDNFVRDQIAAFKGTPQEFLRGLNPLWRLVGRVTFHLAENKRDPENPFAFMATYASGLSAQGRLQHLPLRNALQEYAGAKNKDA